MKQKKKNKKNTSVLLGHGVKNRNGRIYMLDDNNIPVSNVTVSHGFWGNNTTGHLTDEQQK